MNVIARNNEYPMDKIEKYIWNAAMRRVAGVFRKPLDDISPKLKFGEDLKCSFVSNFRRNELDIILDDIHDVADWEAVRDIAAGILVIRTVQDYCEHMIHCYVTKPIIVRQVLHIDE
jgi:hypothetical protein